MAATAVLGGYGMWRRVPAEHESRVCSGCLCGVRVCRMAVSRPRISSAEHRRFRMAAVDGRAARLCRASVAMGLALCRGLGGSRLPGSRVSVDAQLGMAAWRAAHPCYVVMVA